MPRNRERSGQPGPSLWLSVPMLIGGILAAVLSLSLFFLMLVRAELNSPSFAAPGTFQLECSAGHYEIFVPKVVSSEPNKTNMSVSGSSGVALPLAFVTGQTTMSKGSATYEAVMSFQVNQPGAYTVVVSARTGSVVIAPDLGTEGARHRGWLVAFAVAVVIATVGFVMLVVTLVRRSRSRLALFKPSYPRAPAT